MPDTPPVKSGTRRTTPAEPEAAAEAVASEVVAAPVVAAEAAPEPPKPEPGWYRNTAATPLIVQPHQYPSKQLAPGEATWLPDDPHHRDIEPCDEPPPAAADPAGSEK